MIDNLIAAGACLADTLEAENVALAALDLARAAQLLADKQRAVDALAAARPAAVPNEAATRMARRLQALAIENKRLLERAIAAQGRVIGIVAHAAAPQPATGYGASRGQRPTAFAVSSRV